MCKVLWCLIDISGVGLWGPAGPEILDGGNGVLLGDDDTISD